MAGRDATSKVVKVVQIDLQAPWAVPIQRHGAVGSPSAQRSGRNACVPRGVDEGCEMRFAFVFLLRGM